MKTPYREWIEDFVPEDDHHAPLLREIVIQERDGNYFDIFQTHPEPRLLTRLALDECLGYIALAIVSGRPPRWQTPSEEVAWRARYMAPPPRVLEPWEKQLPERAGA